MKSILAMLSLLSLPLILLNMLSGIMSGIWLVILGDWGSIGYGLLAIMVSGMLISIAIMPSFLLVGPAAYFLEKKISFLFYLFAFLSSLYIVSLMTLWCGGVLRFFILRATENSAIPVLIWSYGVALAPWQWLAQKDVLGGGGVASTTTTFFAQIGYIAMVTTALVARVSFVDVITIFVVIMFVGIFINFLVTIQGMRDSEIVEQNIAKNESDT